MRRRYPSKGARMNRDDIIRMAREAELNVGPAGMGQTVWGSDTNLKRFAALVRADEREACAKVCETKLGPTSTDYYGKTYAAAIRARGQA
jgi:hypothetical protein